MAAILDRLPDVRVRDVDVSGIAKQTAREVADDDVAGLAGEMAYHAMLAIFPFLLFLAGIASIIEPVFGVHDLTGRIVDKASQVMPEDAMSLLRSFTAEVVQSRSWFAIVFGLAGTLWASSTAVGVVMKGLNRAYDAKEDRGFVRRKLVALALTFGFAVLMIAATLLLGAGGVMAERIGNALGWRSEVVTAWTVLSFPLSLAMVVLGVALLYWLAPNTGHEFRWITPGAALFAIAWAVASLLFALYLANFGSYNRTYGSLGAVIILMAWLYWTSFILMAGGELNAVLARREDETYRAEQGQKPSPAGTKAQP